MSGISPLRPTSFDREAARVLLSDNPSAALDLFMGPAPKVRVQREYRTDGWKVRIDDPAPTVRGVEMPLPDRATPGETRGGGPPAGHLPLGAWERVEGGWVNEADGQAGAHLTTRLEDDGTVDMSLRVEGEDGSLREYRLAGEELFEGTGRWPAVQDVEELRPGTAPPPVDPGIREDGDWIVIDRVRLPRRQD